MPSKTFHFVSHRASQQLLVFCRSELTTLHCSVVFFALLVTSVVGTQAVAFDDAQKEAPVEAAAITAIEKPTEDDLELIPEDTAFLEIIAPGGTSVSIAGKDFGTQRFFEVSSLKPDRLLPLTVEAQFAAGAMPQRTVLMRGGQQIRLPLQIREHDEDRVVVQQPATSMVGGLAFSHDKRFLLVDDGCAVIDVWDIESGMLVQHMRSDSASGCTLAEWMVMHEDGDLVMNDHYRVWSINSGKVVKTIDYSFDGAAPPLVATADGRRYLLGVDPKTEEVTSRYDALDPLTGETMTFTNYREVTYYQTIALFDLATGKRLRSFRVDSPILDHAISPDQSTVAIYTDDQSIEIFDVKSGRTLKTLSFPPNLKVDRYRWQREYETKVKRNHVPGEKWVWDEHWRVALGLEFSNDGKRLFLFGAETQNEKRTQKKEDGNGEETEEVEYNKAVAQVRLEWDLKSYKIAGWARQLSEPLQFFSSDRSVRLAITDDGAAEVRNIEKNDLLCELSDFPDVNIKQGQPNSLEVAFSHDKQLVAVSADGVNVVIWDATNGNRIKELRQTGPDLSIPYDQRSVDNVKPFRSRGWTETRNYTRSTGPEFHYAEYGDDVPFDEQHGGYHEIRDGETGKVLRRFRDEDGVFPSLTFSSDGQRVLHIESRRGDDPDSEEHTASISDTATGRNSVRLQLPEIKDNSVFSWNGVLSNRRWALLWYQLPNEQASDVDSISTYRYLLFDAASGRLKAGLGDLPYSDPHFSTDENLVFVDSMIFNTANGRLAGNSTAQGKDEYSNAWLLSPNGRLGLAGGALIDHATNEVLAEIHDGLIVTPEGLFDGDANGRMSVAYRIGDGLQVAPVDRFFNELNYPGLLDELLDGKRPMPPRSFEQLVKNKPPKLKIVSPERGGEVSAASVDITVRIEERGGGISGPFVRLNGQRLKITPDVEVADDAQLLTYNIPLTEAANNIRIESATEDGSFESDPAIIRITNVRKLDRPNLYVVAIGVNDYADDSMKLSCARGDADAIATLFESRAEKLFENVEVHRLFDDDVTAARIQELLSDETTGLASRVEPKDMLVVFVAGHGYSVDGNRYYFLPQSFRKESRSFDQDVRDQGIPADVLGDWVSSVKATKRVVILDTCAAGSAVAQLGRSRSAGGFDGAITRLSRTQGVHVIAAASAKKEAREITDLQHGILTYSLLAGMNAVDDGPLASKAISTSQSGYVTVNQWFEYAQIAVPELYEKYIGEQQDVQVQGANSFPVLPLK